MAKPLTSLLVPSFSQQNLGLVVSGRCLHVSVTKFQDKVASLRQVNNPYSWNKFQICCTDTYLIRFLPNLAVFFVFLWISRDFADLPEFRGSATARNIRSPVFSRNITSLWNNYVTGAVLVHKQSVITFYLGLYFSSAWWLLTEVTTMEELSLGWPKGGH